MELSETGFVSDRNTVQQGGMCSSIQSCEQGKEKIKDEELKAEEHKPIAKRCLMVCRQPALLLYLSLVLYATWALPYSSSLEHQCAPNVCVMCAVLPCLGRWLDWGRLITEPEPGSWDGEVCRIFS